MKSAFTFIAAVLLLSGLCYMLHYNILMGTAGVLVAAVGTFRFLDRFDFK